MLKKIKQQLIQGKNLIIFTALRMAGQVLGAVLPLVVAKFFEPELFGSYLLARMVVFLITALTISAAQTPFIVHANQEREKTGKINKSFSVQCIFLAISFCLFFMVIGLFAGPIAAFAKVCKADLIFVSLAFVGFAVHTFLCSLFMALGQRIKNAFASLTYNAFAVLLIIIFYLTDNINLRSVFLVYFLSAGSVVIFFVKTTNFSLLAPFDFDSKHFKEMLNFTKWLMLGVTAAYFINWGDNIVLRIFVPMKDIGIYGFAYQIFKGMIFLTSGLSHYFLPFLSRHVDDKAKLRNYLSAKRPKIIALGLAGLVCIFFSVGYVLKLLYGDVYSQSVPVLQILLIANAVNLYTIFYTCLFYALQKYRFFQIATVVQITINVILNFIFIPYIGILGAAIATVTAYLCRAVILEVYFRLRIRSLIYD